MSTELRAVPQLSCSNSLDLQKIVGPHSPFAPGSCKNCCADTDSHSVLGDVAHSLSVFRQCPELVPCLNQSLDGFPSDGPVNGPLFCFVILRASRWCIMAKSCRLVSSSKSNATFAVISQTKPAFGCRHQRSFMSSHMVTKLIFKGPSQEPQSKLTRPLSSGTEGSTNRSSKMIPSLGCSTINMPVSLTRSTQKSSTKSCSESNYAFPASSSTKGLYAIPGMPDTY